MKKKPAKKPRRNPHKERLEIMQHHAQVNGKDRDEARAELKRVYEGSVRVYRLLEAERAELLARAEKILATMMALELRIEDRTSPMSTRINRWT